MQGDHPSLGFFKIQDTSNNDLNPNLLKDEGACSLSNLDRTIALKLKKGSKNATTVVSRKNTTTNISDAKKIMVSNINQI